MTLLADLVSASQRVGATSARLSKVRELASLLRSLSADEIEIAVHYLSGEIPQGRIGIGHSTLQAAVSNSADSATLSVGEVDRCLKAVARIRGGGSTARRSTALREMFSRATTDEQTFLLSVLAGELRQGALGGIMIEAIAAAAEMPPSQVRRAAMYSKSLGMVARVALLEGAAALGGVALEIFAPISPMLAQSAADAAEALAKLDGELAFEWKMDGARIQAHKLGDEVRIYTRSSNEVTDAVPEIVETIRALPERALILDGEAIAFDRSGRPHPFQMTMRRFGRRLNVEASRAELPIRAFFFDCLRFGERAIADSPARERFDILAQAVPPSLQIPRIITSSEPAARAFYEAAIAAGHEGLMAKSLDAVYEAGSRGAGWLKIKRSHTLDLVVLAAEWGHGRRAGKLSNLHLGALEPQTHEYVMLGKTFKGLTDAMLEWQTQQFLERETHRDHGVVYVRPELVVEIAFSDLQASVRYPGGFALRLARVKRYRPDKRIADADTMESVRTVYRAQAGSARD
ncbi:MAG: ATP-dependent DNA ligase [Steroidobacteraceae bacterium]